MPQRELRYAPTFERDLEALSKKHPDVVDTVRDILQSVAPEGSPHRGFRVTGQRGLLIFTERFPIRNMGKRGSGRIIYYRDGTTVVGLLLFAKNNKAHAPPAEITNALKAAGLLET